MSDSGNTWNLAGRSHVICVKPNVFVLLPPNTDKSTIEENTGNKDWIIGNIKDSFTVSPEILPPIKEITLWVCQDSNKKELLLMVKEDVTETIQFIAQNRMHTLCKVQPIKAKKG